MEKINSFKILTLTLQGFKRHANRQEYHFGDMTYIMGKNGMGKSTIADAIAFALCGTPFSGEKSLDRLHNKENPNLEVSVTIADAAGEIHTLTRTRKANTTRIAFGGVNLRQADINEKFCDKDLFLAMFNPAYFTEYLGVDGRNLLEKHLPVISHEMVLEALKEPLKTTMKDVGISSPETYIANRRAELREHQENIIYYQGQADQRENALKDANDSIQEIETALLSLIKAIEELEALKNSNIDDERLVELYARLDECLIDGQQYKDCSDEKELAEKIVEAERQIEQLTASAYQSDYSGLLSERDANLKKLYQKYEDLKAIIEGLKSGNPCPTCNQIISPQAYKDAMHHLSVQLIACVDAGKSAKLDYDMTIAQDNEAKALFQADISEKAALLDHLIAERKTQYQALAVNKEFAEKERQETIKKINDEIQLCEYQKENGLLEPRQVIELNAYYKEKEKLEAQLEAIKNLHSETDTTDRIADCQEEIKRLQVDINNAMLYLGRKNELLFQKLSMKRVKIQLQEIIKTTGEIKDTFKITYEGRAYHWLSPSEKTKAGLEIAELIKRLSGKQYPTFVDNFESINVIDNVRPISQLIFARVTNHSEVTVTFEDRDRKLQEAV